MPGDSADGTGGRPDPVAPPSRSNRTVTPAIAAALVVLAASFALSVAFVLANGGLDLPVAQRPSGSALAAASPGPGVTATSAVEDSAGPASGGPDGSATAPGASPSSPLQASAAPTLTAAPPSTPSDQPTTRPSSNRYELLRPCPDTPGCWIYVVRQGDNLFSIARYFGVPLSVVQERNPWTRTTQLVAGQKLLLPPPTR